MKQKKTYSTIFFAYAIENKDKYITLNVLYFSSVCSSNDFKSLELTILVM